MDVSYDPEVFRIAQIPESREARSLNMDVADQALGVKVVKVSDLDHDGDTLSRPGKQEGTRFSSTTEASTTKLPNGLLPQVEPNL